MRLQDYIGLILLAIATIAFAKEVKTQWQGWIKETLMGGEKCGD